MPNVIQLDAENKIVGDFFYDYVPDFVGADPRFIVKPHEYLTIGWRLFDEQWLEPLPPEIIPAAPAVLTSFQAKVALDEAGQLASVESLINHPDTPARIKLAWTNGLDFRRDNPMILIIAGQLDWTDEYIDELFAAGSLITPDLL